MPVCTFGVKCSFCDLDNITLYHRGWQLPDVNYVKLIYLCESYTHEGFFKVGDFPLTFLKRGSVILSDQRWFVTLQSSMRQGHCKSFQFALGVAVLSLWDLSMWHQSEMPTTLCNSLTYFLTLLQATAQFYICIKIKRLVFCIAVLYCVLR